MIERLIKRFIIWYFLRHHMTAVFRVDDKFVVRIFSEDFYNNDVIEALREYEWKKKNSENKKETVYNETSDRVMKTFIGGDGI